MGWLAREHGLTCDNVTVVDKLVTAEGEHVRADHRARTRSCSGPPGRWRQLRRLRPCFEFRLHPVGTEALVVELYFTPEGRARRCWAVLGASSSASAPRARHLHRLGRRRPPRRSSPPRCAAARS